MNSETVFSFRNEELQHFLKVSNCQILIFTLNTDLKTSYFGLISVHMCNKYEKKRINFLTQFNEF